VLIVLASKCMPPTTAGSSVYDDMDVHVCPIVCLLAELRAGVLLQRACMCWQVNPAATARWLGASMSCRFCYCMDLIAVLA
jgi:hypothetical protein